MRIVRELWAGKLGGKREPRTVYVGSHEDKLSRIPAMRIDPDDDGRTMEDVRGERAQRRESALLRAGRTGPPRLRQ
jgi:hypothetical protein